MSEIMRKKIVQNKLKKYTWLKAIKITKGYPTITQSQLVKAKDQKESNLMPKIRMRLKMQRINQIHIHKVPMSKIQKLRQIIIIPKVIVNRFRM